PAWKTVRFLAGPTYRFAFSREPRRDAGPQPSRGLLRGVPTSRAAASASQEQAPSCRTVPRVAMVATSKSNMTPRSGKVSLLTGDSHTITGVDISILNPPGPGGGSGGEAERTDKLSAVSSTANPDFPNSSGWSDGLQGRVGSQSHQHTIPMREHQKILLGRDIVVRAGTAAERRHFGAIFGEHCDGGIIDNCATIWCAACGRVWSRDVVREPTASLLHPRYASESANLFDGLGKPVQEKLNHLAGA
ncbi:unnamed protein product, partial [Amoebophrya sp. A120]